MTQRVVRWKEAWESRDVERIAALYEPDATHRSPQVAIVLPELGGSVLHGIEAIRTYALRALARFTWLRFEIVSVTESATRSAVEFLRHSNLDGETPKHGLELIEWSGDRIRSVSVFHG